MTGLGNGWEQKGELAPPMPQDKGQPWALCFSFLASCLQRDFQNFL